VKPAKERQTVRDHLDALETKYRGFTERTPEEDGTVTLRFTYGDGDVAAARGVTTEDALQKLQAKLER
jgi:hypothetical protein